MRIFFLNVYILGIFITILQKMLSNMSTTKILISMQKCYQDKAFPQQKKFFTIYLLFKLSLLPL